MIDQELEYFTNTENISDSTLDKIEYDVNGVKKYKDWPFKPDDWLINFIFSQKDTIFEILTIKDYKSNTIQAIVLDLYMKIEKIRIEKEEQDAMFIKKKEFLIKAEKNGDKSIQIPLEGEYSLKKYITLYKIYEFIGWFAKLRGESTIFKICILEKQRLIEKIVPIADLSVRKVIGAKVISRKSDLFEDFVNSAWAAIITFMPKIDPSRVLFSCLVSIANKSSVFALARHLKHVYKTVQLSVLEDKMNQSDDIDGEFFISSVVNKNEGITASSLEDEMLDKIDKDLELESENLSILEDGSDIDMDEILRNTTLDEESVYKSVSNLNRNSSIEQKILSYCFTVLSGKIRKVCYQKIYAEFFIDLIDQNIPRKIINKYANLFLNVINFDELSSMTATDNENINESLVRMLKSWIKSKQETKLKENVNKENKYSVKVEREQKNYEFVRDNKNALEELIKFRKDCLVFKIDSDGE